MGCRFGGHHGQFTVMRVPKKNITSKVALYYAINSMPPFAGIGSLLDKYLCRHFSFRRENFLDVPVYFVESSEDLSPASLLLAGSADLLSTKAPFWKWQVKNIYSRIMIQGLGPMFSSDRRGRTFTINPLKFASKGESAVVLLTMNLIAALCRGFLLDGRFGYFGVRNSNPIIYTTAARFLRKCNANHCHPAITC